VLTLILTGLTPTQIAAEVGCSRMLVYRILSAT
jgi:DNA-binding CsgD family transcriptional regulator